MANRIIIKQSSTAANVPTAGELLSGELAINVTDEKLYSKNATTVFKVGLHRNDDETIGGDWNFNPSGLGGLTNYDISIGDTDGTPTYGNIRFGNATLSRSSYNVSALDLDGAILLRNVGTPATSKIEFAFAESTNSIRFAIPKSGAGNATYSPRSMIIAGPAVLNDDIVTVGYWQTQGIFDNLTMDTGTSGADLGVQNDLEVEGDIFVDSILESTTATGVTIDGVLIKDGLVDGKDVSTLISSYTETDPTVGAHIKSILAGDITNWDTAYGDKINSAAFNTGTGVITLTRQDAGTVTVDIDGRYATGSGSASGTNTGDNAVNSNYSGLVSDTGVPAMLSSGGLPVLNTGITAAEYRTAIGAQIAGSYLTAETNNLSAAVTWANIPIANVPTGTTSSTVALGNHLHTGVYAPLTTYDYGTTLTGATVFDEVNVTNGQVTSISTRALTSANLGIEASTAQHKVLVGDTGGGWDEDAILNIESTASDVWFWTTGVAGAGDIYFTSGDPNATGEALASFLGNGACILYHNGSQKFATSAAGASVTGTLTATTVSGLNVTSGADPGHTHTTASITGLSGTNTGDQTITLTGDVTGTGTGSFATTIAAGAVDIAMLSATGTPSSSTYLRGDNTWAAVAGGGDLWSDVVDAVITPDGNSTRDLGATAARFRDFYTAKILLGASGSGVFEISGSDIHINALSGDVRLRGAGENMFQGIVNGAATLYYNNIAKIATTATGVSVTGDVAGTTIGGITQANLVDKAAAETVSGAWTYTGERYQTSGGLRFNDNTQLHFGTGEDVDIYFTGTDFYINMINGADFRLRGGATGSDAMITAYDDGAVELYYNAGVELRTQNRTTAGNTSGVEIKDHGGFWKDAGFNTLPTFNMNASDTLEARHCGFLTGKDNTTTTYELLGPTSTDLDFPVGGVCTVANFGASGNYSLEDTTSCTMYYCDGAAAPVDIALNGTLAPGGIITLYRYSSTAIYIFGSGFTP